MPVNKDKDSRRWVEAEVEVPGSPEEVWAAIASGPGITAWFVPTEMDGREGGSVTQHFSPDGTMDSVAEIVEWEPPHRFVATTEEGPPGKVATEWRVEVKAGGTCTVRLVHSWFASTDDWDGQFEGHLFGWASFFRILKLYLGHFSGQPAAMAQLMATAPEPKGEAWAALTTPLGLAGAQIGGRVASPDSAPPLSGVVEQAGVAEWPELLIRLDRPAPGLVHIVPHAMQGQVFLTLRFIFYGTGAAAAAAAVQPVWQAWLGERFAPLG